MRRRCFDMPSSALLFLILERDYFCKLFKKPAVNTWFPMTNSKESVFLIPWQEKPYASCRCFCQNQKKFNRKSKNKSRLGTQKDVNSTSFKVSLKKLKVGTFSSAIQVLTHVIIFDLNRNLETQDKVCVQCCFIPGLMEVTPCPTLSTTPAASCPRIIGKGMTSPPVITWSSERQIPVATIWFREKTRIFQHLTMSCHIQKWNYNMYLEVYLTSD